MFHLKLLILLLAVALPSHAFDHEYAGWTTLLKLHVQDGLVTYAAIKAHPAELDAVLAALAAVPPAALAEWTREQRLAFWLNAYNAYTFKAIVTHYPLSRRGLRGLAFPANSIRQIPGVWDKLTWPVAGEALTLDQMEHQKLRAELAEPRIHFALVCAARSCPKLRTEAYTPARVDEQLKTATTAFLRDPARTRVDLASKTLHLSKIFEWVGQDFAGTQGISGYGDYNGVVAFILPYLPEEAAAALREDKFDLRFLDYDWTLNDRAVPLPTLP